MTGQISDWHADMDRRLFRLIYMAFAAMVIICTAIMFI
jgi:hypothetical protein